MTAEEFTAAEAIMFREYQPQQQQQFREKFTDFYHDNYGDLHSFEDCIDEEDFPRHINVESTAASAVEHLEDFLTEKEFKNWYSFDRGELLLETFDVQLVIFTHLGMDQFKVSPPLFILDITQPVKNIIQPSGTD